MFTGLKLTIGVLKYQVYNIYIYIHIYISITKNIFLQITREQCYTVTFLRVKKHRFFSKGILVMVGSLPVSDYAHVVGPTANGPVTPWRSASTIM